MYRANGEMSSTFNQHNNADFSDELDLPNLLDSDEPELRKLDEIDEKKNDIAKTDVLSIILSKYGDDGVKLEECFRLHEIEYKDLASLSDDDLLQFGVTNATNRRVILDDFSELLHQDQHYDRQLAEMNIDEYGYDGLNNIRRHLSYLKLAIRGSLLKLKLQISSDPPEDVYVSNELNASELVLKTLEELKNTSNLMEKQLSNLSKKNIKNEIKTSKTFKCWKFLLVLGATAISSAVLYKYFRTKLFKF